jgi:hypothetical protein
MKGQLTKSSYAEIQSDLNGVVDWIESFGVNVAPTRIRRYETAMQTVRKIQEARDEARANKILPDAINTLHEIHDLIEIGKGFSGGNYRDFVEPKIKEIVAGPDAYADENLSSSNRARNVAFELIVASRIAQSGLPLFRRGTSDIATRLHGRIVLIECKRPFAEAKVARRIQEGFSQLKRAYHGCDSIRTRGIVAIDVTRAHNPDFLPMAYDQPYKIGRIVAARLDAISGRYSETIEGCRQKKTIGVVFRMSAMALPTGEAERLTYCQQYEVHSYSSSASQDQSVMVELFDRLMQEG